MLSRLLLVAFIAPVFTQDLFLQPAIPVAPEPTRECAPLGWIKQDFGTGHWILNYTDVSWEAYMKFLGVDEKHWPDEFNASDIHQYAMYDDTFIMNHTIPLTNFSLLFETDLTGKWVKNPYPTVTPAGLDPKAKVNLTTFLNVFEKPGVPHPDSCHALRTEMPVGKKNAVTGKVDMYMVVFWRELTSPIDMRCTLHVLNATSDTRIEPWASQMHNAKPFPDYSYRYFRKTVQGWDDVLKRRPCNATGIRSGTYFC